MKKLFLTAAFFIALSSYAAAQTNEGTTSAQTATTTEKAITDSKEKIKKEKPRKISRKERKAAEAMQAAKSVKITVPIPDMSNDTIPKKEND